MIPPVARQVRAVGVELGPLCTMADLLAETEVRGSDEDHPEDRPEHLVSRRYPTPWTRCDREADYRKVWAELEHRRGKKVPEGTWL